MKTIKIITTCLLLTLELIPLNAKDSEDDIFLQNVVSSLNGDSELKELGFSLKYEKRCFYIERTFAMKIPKQTTSTQIEMGSNMIANDENAHNFSILMIEEKKPGFLQHMINAKAKVESRIYIRGTSAEGVMTFEKKALAAFLNYNETDIEVMSRNLVLTQMNAFVPLDMGDGTIIKSMLITNSSLVINIAVDERIPKLEELAKDRSAKVAAIMAGILNDARQKAFFQDFDIGLVFRFSGLYSHQYFEMEIPNHTIKDILLTDRPKDALGIVIYLELLDMQKNLPEKLNSERIMTGASLNYKDMIIRFTIQTTGNDAKYFRMYSAKPDILQLHMGYGMITNDETRNQLKDVIQAGVSYEYIIKGEGIKDSLVVPLDHDFLKLITESSQWQLDSMKLVLAVEQCNFSSAQRTHNSHIESTTYYMEKDNIVEQNVVDGTLYESTKRYPVTAKRLFFENAGSMYNTIKMVADTKRNYVVRIVKKNNKKERFDIVITNSELRSIVQ